MRRAAEYAHALPGWGGATLFAPLLPGRLERAALGCLTLFAALVVVRPWLPVTDYVRLSAVPNLLCAFLTAAICLVGPGRRDRAALFTGLGNLSYAVGLLVDISGVFQGGTQQAPSVSDLAYLPIYPLCLLGLFSLPRRRLPFATLGRMVLDGVMIMLAALIFSWFFILGPLLLQREGTGMAIVVAAAYPLGDLVVACCLLLIVSPAVGVARAVGQTLGLSMALVIAANVAFAFQIADGTYVKGGPLDLLWAVAHLLTALAVTTLRQRGGETPTGMVGTPVATLRWSLLPYTFLPAVVILLIYARHSDTPRFLLDGLTMITGLLIVTVLVRQLLTVVENVRLQRVASENARRLAGVNAALERAQVALLARNEELAAANGRLEALATTDALTGLPNHRATAAEIELALVLARDRAQPGTFLFFDIDHFKAINDTHGHAVGDAVLRELAGVARAALRAGDYVGRWGGEEFVAILRGTAQAEAPVIAERLRAAVAGHRFGGDGGLHLTCSIGLATTPQDGLTRAEVLHRADLAMYLAKQLGRNRVCVVAGGTAEEIGGTAVLADEEPQAASDTFSSRQWVAAD